MKMLPQLMDNFDTANQMKCPSCGECGRIDYLYIGDRDTRIGYFQLWCNKCLKGIHISRAIAPLNVPETSGYQKYRYFDPYIFIIDVENSHTDKNPNIWEYYNSLQKEIY